MGSRLRRAAAAVMSVMLTLSGCGSGITIPGATRPGANRPPVIAQAGVTQSGDGPLRLSAASFDPEGDGVSIRYVQINGPFDVQTGSIIVGGVLSVTLEPGGDGLHAFRIIASDGLFEVAANVSIVVGDGSSASAGFDSGAAARALPEGRFRIHLAGTVVAEEGLSTFALEGTLVIEAPADTFGGGGDLIVTLTTDASPFFVASPGGALQFSSSGVIDQNVFDPDGSVDPLGGSATTPDGPQDDWLSVQLFGPDIVLAGPTPQALGAGISPGQFRTDGMPGGAFNIAAAWIRLRPIGEQITGEVFLSSIPMDPADLPHFNDYAAQITGSRTR
ncbi:MAG: hypothetical protein V3T70_09610 [Phycisphaerae bacterium]